MSGLSNYTFLNEYGQEVTLRLSEADAERRGLTGFMAAAVHPVESVPHLADPAAPALDQAAVVSTMSIDAELAAAAELAKAPAAHDTDTTAEADDTDDDDNEEVAEVETPEKTSPRPRAPRKSTAAATKKAAKPRNKSRSADADKNDD